MEKENKVFERFKVRDVVFLAILSAVTIASCAVMPLVVTLQYSVFGIVQVVTALQMSVFLAIGLIKVQKTGTLLFFAFFTGLIQLLLAPPMFFANIVIGIILEGVALAVFRGFKKRVSVFVCTALYVPLTVPFYYLYNLAIGNDAITAVAAAAPLAAVGMTAAVVAISITGTLIGMKIAKELKKSGVLKN